MPKDGEVELISAGVRELLQSTEVQQELRKIGAQIGEFEKEFVGQYRASVIVKEEQ